MTTASQEMPVTLQQTVTLLSGVGPKRVEALGRLGIRTLEDLLLHLPRDYEDRRSFTAIGKLEKDQKATIRGEVREARSLRFKGRQTMAVIKVADDTGTITATFFGRGFLANTTLRPGTRVVVTGTVGSYKGLALRNPEFEVMTEEDGDALNTGRIVPIYRLTEGITQRLLRQWVAYALDRVADWGDDPVPAELVARRELPDRVEAFREAHFPEALEASRAARRRFAYEELVAIQLRILRARARRRHEELGCRHTINGPALKALHRLLPFALTAGQERVIADLLTDMAEPRPMARLLQGDVGCGKTIVALHAIAAALDGGYQAAIMAPTEILAEQHYLSLRPYLTALGQEPVLITGSVRAAKVFREELAEGRARVAIGTQALIQEATTFANLGLVVVDEQHRFGVLQRHTLAKKGHYPDILQMSATPIPRTLAITLYGALDVSVIDELPPGRQPIKTRYVPEDKVADLYAWVCEQVEQDARAYIVCPLVEESEAREQKAVLDHFEELCGGALSGVRTGLLHGRLDASEKEAVMQAFKAGDLDVLVTTTVIEVGVDVPEASIMVIEDASQFGLTQLHQLRGRVGRGIQASYCFLVGAPRTPEGRERIDILCAHASGFDIAEADLKMRGPGEVFGKRQAGMPDLRVADLIQDARLLDTARRDAAALLGDPTAEA
jgi:ATP-dependent DNA helicase RecG